jgi:hypothetical protein
MSDPLSETAVYYQSVYYNDVISSNQESMFVNVQQVKWSGELREKGREIESSRLTEWETERCIEMEVTWVINGC